MNLHRMLKKTERLITDNSPLILTAIGVTGTITTAYLTGTASFRAAKLLEDERYHRNVKRLASDKPIELEPREKFDLVWKLYVPATGAAALTIAAIVGANRVGTRRAAAMAAAYSISEKAYSEYKEKVVEQIGKTKEEKIRAEIAQDRVNRNPPVSSEVIVVNGDGALYQDGATGRYFRSDMESIRKAQNDINFQIINDDYATLTNFYNNIGLPPTTMSDELGWNTDKRLELLPPAAALVPAGVDGIPEGTPCVVIDFATVPIREPWRFC